MVELGYWKTKSDIPVVVGSFGCVLGNLCLALLWHGSVLHILLQAADDAGVTMRHILAKLIDGCGAILLHWELEVDVLCHVDLLVKERSPALIRQVLSPASRKHFELGMTW